ncbi:MAG: phosphate ABC transporter permease PstA [Phycisphaeraceae bacterium]|nr:phosphate ABC transporter permease PstA [Phycisphaeraceae bacterium]
MTVADTTCPSTPPRRRGTTGGASPRRVKAMTSLAANGEPMIWLTGGSLAACLVMVLGLLAIVFVQGIGTFWPARLVQIETSQGARFMGEVTRHDRYQPQEQTLAALPVAAVEAARKSVNDGNGWAGRRLLRTGNFELTNEHFTWVSDFEIASESLPPWAMLLERMAWGRFYGVPTALLVDGQPVATDPQTVWARFQEFHPGVLTRVATLKKLETEDIGHINAAIENARLDIRAAELSHGADSSQVRAARERVDEVNQRVEQQFKDIQNQIAAIHHENDRYVVIMTTADGKTKNIKLSDIVRAFPANQLSFMQRVGVYFSRWWEFLVAEPREANSEGGVFPAIYGTVLMTLIMSFMVVPFGVLSALYLREYAKAGPMISAVRIAINNLAGVPSIVFGVFGLGFFCYIVGAGVDEWFFPARLPNPTYGKGGLLWASFTLALLTLPVVIVATEESLAAVPGSMREGSYACGASKWQTIVRIVLPRALPGIMTGAILAMARGAGEVAPLMLVGAVKLAPELPLDASFPFLHPQRSFMHLGFHIYDLGFQSPNSEAAKPMVFTTTLLLIVVIATLNLAAVWLRGRLRRRFVSNQF